MKSLASQIPKFSLGFGLTKDLLPRQLHLYAQLFEKEGQKKSDEISDLTEFKS